MTGQAFRAAANRENELWLGMPKGGRTLGASDDQFLSLAGITINDKIARIDDATYTDIDTANAMGIRQFELKPMMALNLLSQGKLDCAIVGRDVVKEFNARSRGRKGIMQAVELLDTGLSNCALTIALNENDPARTPQDLQGRTVVTKYPEVVVGWARANKFSFEKIISGINDDGDIPGGIEGYSLFDPSVTIIADMVESGESLVRYGLQPLGINSGDWGKIKQDVLNDVPKADRQRFIDLGARKLDAIQGVIIRSSAVLVRNAKELTPEKEARLTNIVARFYEAADELGGSPIEKPKNVSGQQRLNWQQRRPVTTPGPAGHAQAWGLR